tara:strand:+ start:256 stop:492 length:237 start_codon:yes stop_codon:yes gene_type:complete
VKLKMFFPDLDKWVGGPEDLLVAVTAVYQLHCVEWYQVQRFSKGVPLDWRADQAEKSKVPLEFFEFVRCIDSLYNSEG